MGEMESLLAQTPEHMRKGLEDLLSHTRRQREAYGFEVPEGVIPTPLSMEEIKQGEVRNAQAIVKETVEHHAFQRDLDDWFDVFYDPKRPTHNRDLPMLAFQTVASQCWTPEEERRLVEAAWTLPEWPGQWPKQEWLLTFGRVGFICSVVEDGGTCQWHPAEDSPGDETVQVWRGAFMSERRGMSWTTDRDRALWFVKRGDMSGKRRKMRLWTAKATPDRVLAHFHRRSEDEFVLDAHGLKITEEQM